MIFFKKWGNPDKPLQPSASTEGKASNLPDAAGNTASKEHRAELNLALLSAKSAASTCLTRLHTSCATPDLFGDGTDELADGNI